jgi:hypothetical protein
LPLDQSHPKCKTCDVDCNSCLSLASEH